MKWQTNDDFWKDALTLPQFLLKIKKETLKLCEGQRLKEEELFELMMKRDDFKAMVAWKGTDAVKHLLTEEEKRETKKNDTQYSDF